MDWIAALIEKIYKLSGPGVHRRHQGHGQRLWSGSLLPVPGGQQQPFSGLAELCEKAEKQIARIFGLWTRREIKDLSISYPRDFNVVDLEAEVKRGLDALTMGISETFDRELKKALARKLLGQGVCRTRPLAQIDEEIEAADVYENQAEERGQSRDWSAEQPADRARGTSNWPDYFKTALDWTQVRARWLHFLVAKEVQVDKDLAAVRRRPLRSRSLPTG